MSGAEHAARAHELAWRLVFEAGGSSEIPLYCAVLDLDAPRVRRHYEPMLGAHGSIATGEPRLEHRKGEIEFLYDAQVYSGAGSYQMFLNELAWRLVESRTVWLVSSGIMSHDRREIPRRLRIELDDFKYPELADGGRVAKKLRIGFVAPHALFEDLEELRYPEDGPATLTDGNVLAVPVVSPDGGAFPSLRMHPIIEISSDSPIKSLALYNLASAGERGFGERLELALFDYFPGEVIRIDSYSTPGGGVTVGGVDRIRSLAEHNGFPRLYAGVTRWQIRSPDGPVRVRVRYRRNFVR